MRVFDTCSLVAGSVARDGTAAILVMNDRLAEDRRQHTIPLLLGPAGWVPLAQESVVPWVAAGAAPIDGAKRRFAVVGWGGQVIVTDGSRADREALLRSDGHVSIVRCVAPFQGTAVTSGMRRQVYRRAEGGWHPIDAGMAAADPAVGLNAIDGGEDGALYAAGIDGELWHDAGQGWTRVDGLTNVHLHAVHCSSVASVFVGGRSGVLLGGSRDRWSILETPFEETIWSLQEFAGALYLLTDNAVWAMRGQTFEIVSDPAVDGGEFHAAAQSDSELWLFGRKRVARFDGSGWRVEDDELPDPVPTEVAIFFDDRVVVQGSAFLPDEE